MRNSLNRSSYTHNVVLPVLIIGALGVATFALADIGSGSFTTNTSTNITITNLTLSKPSDTTEGDFLLASVTIKNGATGNITAPAGWTQIRRTDNGTNVSIVSYWKVAGSSEPPSYAWTITPQTRAVGGITRYTGVNTTDPIDTSSGSTGRSNIATASSVTTTSANAEIVALYGSDTNASFSTPAGMTEKYDTGNSPSIAEDDMLQAAAGATGDKPSSIGSKRNWVAQLIALRSASIFPPSPIAYWKFDESGGNAIDSTGHGNVLTNNNGITYGTGKINNGADFEKDSGQYLNATADIVGSTFTAYTVNLWFKPESHPATDKRFTMVYELDTPGWFRIWYRNVGGTNEFQCSHEKADGSEANLTNIGSLALGTWYMMTMTWDGSSMNCYLNASSVGPAVSATNINTSGAMGLGVGADPDGDLNTMTDGLIDELGIWSRALTAAEISSLYNNGNGITL